MPTNLNQMIAIPHVKRPTKPCFIRTIRDELKNFNSHEITIVLDNECAEQPGYKGCYEIHVSLDEDTFLANYPSERHATRFPARIRAAAKALQLLELDGHYRIEHKNKVVYIEKLD